MKSNLEPTITFTHYTVKEGGDLYPISGGRKDIPREDLIAALRDHYNKHYKYAKFTCIEADRVHALLYIEQGEIITRWDVSNGITMINGMLL